MTEHKLLLHSRLCQNNSVVDDDYDEFEDGTNDDDEILVARSCMGSDSGDDVVDVDEYETTNLLENLEAWKNLTETEKGKLAANLKKLGNAKQRKFNKLRLSDSFVGGNESLMKTIVKDREKAIWKMRRNFDLVQMSISYSTKMMQE